MYQFSQKRFANHWSISALVGLAYSRMVLRREKHGKAYANITDRTLQILDAQAETFEARSKATASIKNQSGLRSFRRHERIVIMIKNKLLLSSSFRNYPLILSADLSPLNIAARYETP